MANNCCNLVGNFDDVGFTFPTGCFISVNANENTEYGNFECVEGTDVSGYTVGSLNLSAYIDPPDVYIGCPGRAGVQILWLRKYDCNLNQLHFIYAGEGRSFRSIEADEYVDLNTEFNKRTRMINASSQSGPSALYTDTEQIEGLGMTFGDGPITFNTSTADGCTLDNMGIGTSPYYLQNFNMELVPGNIPVVNYTFAYIP